MDLIRSLSSNTHAKVFYDEPMKKHTSYGVGGNASCYVEADSLYTLNEIVSFAKENKIPYKTIGNGTNVLVSEKGYNGIEKYFKRMVGIKRFSHRIRLILRKL